MTKDSAVFGTGLEWVWKVGLFLDENWKGIGKALERRGGWMASGGEPFCSAGLFHDALSEGVVARCCLQVVDKLRGAMLFVCYCGAGQGGGQRGRRGQCFCGLFAFGEVGVFSV